MSEEEREEEQCAHDICPRPLPILHFPPPHPLLFSVVTQISWPSPAPFAGPPGLAVHLRPKKKSQRREGDGHAGAKGCRHISVMASSKRPKVFYRNHNCPGWARISVGTPSSKVLKVCFV